MREPPGIQKCDGSTDRPTDKARCRVACPRLKTEGQTDEKRKEEPENEKQKSVAEVDQAKERENEAKEEKPTMQKLELEEELVSETEINK